jgi:hypothetical protein
MPKILKSEKNSYKKFLKKTTSFHDALNFKFKTYFSLYIKKKKLKKIRENDLGAFFYVAIL